MFKRILSIILAAAMLLSFPVFAEDTEAEIIEANAVVEDSGNVAFLKAFDLIGEDALGTNPMKRGAFAKMFCTIARYDIKIPAMSKVAFTDVSADDSSAVGAVAAMGIMGGVGGGLFQPENNVTYIQALKAVVTFLGYGQNAEAKGGYPYGYYMQATELGIVKNAPTNMNVEITVEKAAELFKLALNVDLRVPQEYKDQALYYEPAKDLTYLEYYRNILRERGLVEANVNTDLSGNGKVDNGRIRVAGEEYKYDIEKMDAAALIGCQVDIYYDGDSKDLYFIETAGATVEVIEDEEMSGLNGDKIEYFRGDKKRYFKIDDKTRVLYNGEILLNYAEEDINPFAVSTLDGSVELVDNNSDGVFDFIFVDAYETYLVDKVIDERIYTRYRDGMVIDLTDRDAFENKLLLNLNGEALKFPSLSAGHTLSVSRSQSGVITKVIATNDTFIGTLEARREVGGKVFLRISGIDFETSNSIILNPEFDKLKIGAKVEAFFNKDALISDVNYTDHNEKLLGYLANFAPGTNMETNYFVRIFTDEGEWKTYELAESISVNAREVVTEEGTIYKDTKIEADQFLATVGADANGEIVRQPIYYTINADGKINTVLLANTTNTSEPFFMFEGFDGVTENPYTYRTKPKSHGGKLLVLSTTKVFAVPSDEDRDVEKDYIIRAVNFTGFMGNGSKNKFEAYGTKDRPVATVVVYKGFATATTPAFSTSTYSMAVSDVEHYLDENGEEVYKITGYSGSNLLEHTDDGSKIHVGPGGTLPAPGDIITVQTDVTTGDIIHIRYYYDASTDTLYNGVDSSTPLTTNMTSAKWEESPRFALGRVTYFDNEIMTIDTYDNNGILVASFSYPLSEFRLNYISKQGDTIVVEPGKAKQITGEYQAAGLGSKVVVHTYGGQNRNIHIIEE